ncbi:MAG: hypothetical protein ACRELB_18400 [Polyangiaceae bacterium]
MTPPRSLASWGSVVRLHERGRRAEARAAAAKIMRLVRGDLERLADGLAARGYRFDNPRGPLGPLGKGVADRLRRLEAISGPLPLSLWSALAHLGACDFSGDHPDWPHSANVGIRPARSDEDAWLTDPFVLLDVKYLLEQALDHQPHDAPFDLVFSGDALTKAGYSGGTYAIAVPNDAPDARIIGEPRRRSFIAHLALALRHGGLAGWAGIRGRPRGFLRGLERGAYIRRP